MFAFIHNLVHKLCLVAWHLPGRSRAGGGLDAGRYLPPVLALPGTA